MSPVRLSLRSCPPLLARILLGLSLVAAVLTPSAVQATTPSLLAWQVFIDVVQGLPGTMCVGETASIYVIISWQNITGRPMAPPLQTGGRWSATASQGTVTPAGGTWVKPAGRHLTYRPTKAGRETIRLTADLGSMTATSIALSTTVAECQYDIGITALKESKTDTWWWLASLEGEGRFGPSEGSALAGSGTYAYYVDGLWKAKSDALRCALVDPIEGSSAFQVTGTSQLGGVLVSLAFSASPIPAATYRCVDKEGKESENPLWSGSQYNPHTDVAGVENMVFPPAGGEWPIQFGDGEGAVYVTRRSP